MIVVSIIVFLVSFALFPYSYYMKRSYVERTRDMFGQEWILAHKEVRNGKLFDTDKHAHIALIFERSKAWIEEYIFSWSTTPALSDFVPDTSNPDIKFEKFLAFDSDIRLLDFHGFTGADTMDRFGYVIEPPFWKGLFFTGWLNSEFSLTGIYLTIGYNWASLDTGHAREMLLRPYLQ